jgi:DNA modification methylase
MSENQIILGDSLEVLKTLPDNSVDSVVTDPPYGLGKEPNVNEVLQSWITNGYHEIKGSGFMGKEWDAFVPQPIFWKEVFRVLKPGGHVLSFFGTRTYDWGVMAIRLAGFEIRDTIYWHHGSGFPKSHNISVAIDKIHGAEREVVGKQKYTMPKADNSMGENSYGISGGKLANGTTAERIVGDITAPATDLAKHWDGWGSALKPASEPIVLARKPLEKGLSIAENVLKWGTGGINIDGCRVGLNPEIDDPWLGGNGDWSSDKMAKNVYEGGYAGNRIGSSPLGRFPANLIMTHHPDCLCHGLKRVKGQVDKPTNRTQTGNTWNDDNSGLRKNLPKNSGGFADENGQETIEDWTCHEDCPIRIMDEQSGESKSKKTMRGEGGGGDKVQQLNYRKDSLRGHTDKGGASRFFYCAKASKSERGQGNNHPTVKPIKLMEYLVTLITPENGIVLEPFGGSGTTALACMKTKKRFILIEREPEYIEIIKKRIKDLENKTPKTLFD